MITAQGVNPKIHPLGCCQWIGLRILLLIHFLQLLHEAAQMRSHQLGFLCREVLATLFEIGFTEDGVNTILGYLNDKIAFATPVVMQMPLAINGQFGTCVIAIIFHIGIDLNHRFAQAKSLSVIIIIQDDGICLLGFLSEFHEFAQVNKVLHRQIY